MRMLSGLMCLRTLWVVLGFVGGVILLSGIVAMVVDPSWAWVVAGCIGSLAALVIENAVGSPRTAAAPGAVSGPSILVIIAVVLVLIHIVSQISGVPFVGAVVDMKKAGWGTKLIFATEPVADRLNFWIAALLIIIAIARGGVREGVGPLAALIGIFCLFSWAGIKAPAIKRYLQPTVAGVSETVTSTARAIGVNDTWELNSENFAEVKIYDSCCGWYPRLNPEGSVEIVRMEIACVDSDRNPAKRTFELYRDGRPQLDRAGKIVIKNGHSVSTLLNEVVVDSAGVEHLVSGTLPEAIDHNMMVLLVVGGEVVFKSGSPVTTTNPLGSAVVLRKGDLNIHYINSQSELRRVQSGR